jgi:hypothetical protein
LQRAEVLFVRFPYPNNKRLNDGRRFSMAKKAKKADKKAPKKAK